MKLTVQEWKASINRRFPEYVNSFLPNPDDHLIQQSDICWLGPHPDQHPSEGGKCLDVNPIDGIALCRNCKWTGDIIGYEMSRSGCDFITAIETISKNLAVEMPSIKGDTVAAKEERDKAKLGLAILNETVDYYHKRLTPDARQYFINRGINNETINELKLGFAPNSERSLFDHLKTKGHNIDDIFSTGVCRKLDNGKIVDCFSSRYMFPYYLSKDRACYLIGRDALNKEDRSKYKKLHKADPQSPAVLNVLWNSYSISDDKKRHVLITEGITDAILARQEIADRYDVISPVTTHISNNDVERLANLLIAYPLRRVIICNDNDANRAGAKGALETAKKLRRSIADRIIKAKKSEAEAAGKTFTAPTIDSLLPLLPDIRIATLQKEPHVESVDVADYIECGKTDMLLYWIDSAVDIERYQQYLNRNSKRFFMGKTYRPKYLTDELRSEGRYYIGHNKQIRRYENGVYLSDEEYGVIKREITTKLWEQRNTGRVDEAIEDLMRECQVPPSKVNPPNIVCTKTCFVDIETLDEIPFTPDIITTRQVNAILDEDADCPMFKQFLSEIASGYEQLIFEMIGYCLHNSAHMHKAFMLVGEGNNGKSTLLEALEIFFGKDNIANIALQDLEDNRFKIAEIDGKYANLYADLPKTPLQKCSIFNTVVGGDAIMVERKNVNPFKIWPTATQIFSCNELPKSWTTSKGFYRRLIIIEFLRDFSGADKRKRKEIIAEITTDAELSGILVEAIMAYQKALVNGSFTIPEASKDALKRYKRDNESTRMFFDQYLVKEEGSKIAKKDVRELYDQWADDLKMADKVKEPSSTALYRKIETYANELDYYGDERDDIKVTTNTHKFINLTSNPSAGYEDE